MATIRPYDSKVSVDAPLPGRSPERLYATPDSFGGNEGLPTLAKGLDNAGDTLYQAAQQDETTAVSVDLAKKRAKWTAELQKRSASNAVDDPEFASKFSEEVQNDLTSSGTNLSTIGGQRAFQRGSAELTSTLLTNASVTAVHAAGARAVTAATETMNANIDTLTRDPTQLASILTDTDAALHDPNGAYATMPAEQRDKLGLMAKEQYAFATARAYIRQSPETALQAFNDGKLPGQQFLKNQTGSEVVQLANSAINASRIKRIQQDADDARLQRINSVNAGRDIFDGFLKNPGDTTLADKVYNDQNMTWQDKNSLLGAMGRSAKPMADHDMNTYGSGFYDVYHAIGNGQEFTQKQLFDAVGPRPNDHGQMVDGPLTAAGVDKIIALQQSKRTPEGSAEAQMVSSALASVKNNLTYAIPGIPLKDPKGTQANAMFLQSFLPAYEAGKQADPPQTPQQMLNFDDPKSLISTSMAKFKRSLAQIQKDMSDESSSVATATQIDTSKATSTATAPNGEKAYLIDGKWMKGDGSAIGAK
jgi:hypothetical protein